VHPLALIFISIAAGTKISPNCQQKIFLGAHFRFHLRASLPIAALQAVCIYCFLEQDIRAHLQLPMMAAVLHPARVGPLRSLYKWSSKYSTCEQVRLETLENRRKTILVNLCTTTGQPNNAYSWPDWLLTKRQVKLYSSSACRFKKQPNLQSKYRGMNIEGDTAS
jgi:hypothetical protein